ncbi:MAG: tetratricopeptide repeat protein [Pseudomonadota bacterium]
MNDLTEEQQVEQLREWWANNGLVVMLGVAVFIAGFFGTRYWRTSQLRHAEAASAVYEQAGEAAAAADAQTLLARYDTLKRDYADSPYVAQTGLRLAALHLNKGELDAAESVLQGALSDTGDTATRSLIATRLARVQIYADKPEAGLQTLEQYPYAAYQSLIDELRGDALVALARADEALSAYEAAAAAAPDSALVDPMLIGMKIAKVKSTMPVVDVEPEAEAADDS